MGDANAPVHYRVTELIRGPSPGAVLRIERQLDGLYRCENARRKASRRGEMQNGREARANDESGRCSAEW